MGCNYLACSMDESATLSTHCVQCSVLCTEEIALFALQSVSKHLLSIYWGQVKAQRAYCGDDSFRGGVCDKL